MLVAYSKVLWLHDGNGENMYLAHSLSFVCGVHDKATIYAISSDTHQLQFRPKKYNSFRSPRGHFKTSASMFFL